MVSKTKAILTGESQRLNQIKAEMGLDKKTRGPEIARQCIWLMGGIAGAYWLDFGFAQLHKQVSWVRGTLNAGNLR